MLHIINGDSTATLLKEAQVEGEMVVWREALIAGPTPAGLSVDEWVNLRARFLSEGYEQSFADCEKDLRRQEEALTRVRHHDEIVLWFEHDLFCQITLIYLLDRLSECNTGQAKLSLICIDGFPGKPNFKGLGELSPSQVGSLLPTRQEISSRQKELGAIAWGAYCSSSPAAIEELLTRDLSALPFLQPAIEKHLQRFPSEHNGLGLIENTALRLIDDGNVEFAGLFNAFMREEPLYGYGDLQFLSDVRKLVDAERPLLKLDPRGATQTTQASIPKLAFEITDFAKAVMIGAADFVAENSISFWLGGVRLTNNDHWRWNGQRMILHKA